MNFDNLCMNCFEKLENGSVCTHCKFDNDSITDMLYLPRKSTLQNRYIVGNVIGEESDSVSYIGYDTKRNKVVVIRELLPSGIANRLEGNLDVHVRERFRKNFANYKKNFLKLWNTLMNMNSLSAVIPVVDVFEMNETAYAVCEKIDYVTLHDFLLKTEKGYIEWEKARLMFMPILTTLENLHKEGLIHGRITPDNMVLCRDGKVKLIGFCVNQSISVDSELKFEEAPGYTALEQYSNSHKVSGATDIYAFCACLYRALVGNNPPSATQREINDKLMIPNKIAESIPAYVIKAMGAGLQIYPENRVQDVYDFRELLNAAPSVVARSKIEEDKPEKDDDDDVYYRSTRERHRAEMKKQKAKEKQRKKVTTIVAIILVIVLIIVAAVGVKVYRDKTETTTEAVSVEMETVPNFCNGEYNQTFVQNQGTWNDWFKITYEFEYSDSDEGVIIKQSVAAGESVQKGSAIVLTVSKGVEMVEIPDVGGISQEAATQTLEKLGLSVSVVYVYNDGSYTAGNVKTDYGVSPTRGSKVAKGSEVIIQVYDEVETTTEASTSAEE